VTELEPTCWDSLPDHFSRQRRGNRGIVPGTLADRFPSVVIDRSKRWFSRLESLRLRTARRVG
jgi:hypothetical protein